MTTTNTHISQRPLYTRPLLWVTVLILGVGNIVLQRIRADGLTDFFTQSPWHWPEVTIGAINLILVVTFIVSFVRARPQRHSRDTL